MHETRTESFEEKQSTIFSDVRKENKMFKTHEKNQYFSPAFHVMWKNIGREKLDKKRQMGHL